MFNGFLQFICTFIRGISAIGNAIANTRFEARDAGRGGGSFAEELDTTNMSVFGFVRARQNFDLDETETFEDDAGCGSCRGVDSETIHAEFEKIGRAIVAHKLTELIKVHSKVGRVSFEMGVVC